MTQKINSILDAFVAKTILITHWRKAWNIICDDLINKDIDSNTINRLINFKKHPKTFPYIWLSNNSYQTKDLTHLKNIINTFNVVHLSRPFLRTVEEHQERIERLDDYCTAHNISNHDCFALKVVFRDYAEEISHHSRHYIPNDRRPSLNLEDIDLFKIANELNTPNFYFECNFISRALVETFLEIKRHRALKIVFSECKIDFNLNNLVQNDFTLIDCLEANSRQDNKTIIDQESR